MALADDRDDWSGVRLFGDRSESERWVIRPSAYGLLEDAAGRVAVVRSRDGLFLPGGGIEGGESVADAIRREGLEECGLLLRPESWDMRAVQLAWSATEGAYFEKRSTFRACVIERSDASRRQPGHETLWLDFAAAAQALTHPSHGWVVARWRERVPTDS